LAFSAEAAPRAKSRAEDPVALAGMVLRDGDYGRAAQILAAVDPASKGVDVPRYWTLLGLVALHEDRAPEAVQCFSRALAAATESRELIELHLARALLASGEPAHALLALDRAGDVAAALPGTWILRAQAAEAAGFPDAARTALVDGAARFPGQAELARQEVLLLVRLGLFQEAIAAGEALLEERDGSSRDAVVIAEALRRAGEPGRASAILDAALAIHGDDRELLLQAARASMDDGAPRSAARFLDRAAVLDPALAVDAAEAYRRAGEIEAALRLNAEVEDAAVKARQRLGLAIDAADWDRAVALAPRLRRLGLDADDGVRYAVAYAYFRRGDLAAAESWLADIADPAVFRRATDLRQAMASCADGDACP
jgi:tetratricopeptide (TPR) repeat protein